MRLDADNGSEPDVMATFIVGAEQKKFIIHKEVACKHSYVLRTEFDGPFIKDRTAVYTLEDTDTEVFRLFFEFLYREKVIFKSHNPNPADDVDKVRARNHTSKCEDQDYVLVDLWILADRFMVRPLQNLVIDQLSRVATECGLDLSDSFQSIYDRTLEGSQLRRFIANRTSWLLIDEGDTDHYPREMLVDMVLNLQWSAPESVRNRNLNRMNPEDFYTWDE